MLKECGAKDFFGNKKEVKELPNIIQDNELLKFKSLLD